MALIYSTYSASLNGGVVKSSFLILEFLFVENFKIMLSFDKIGV